MCSPFPELEGMMFLQYVDGLTKVLNQAGSGASMTSAFWCLLGAIICLIRGFGLSAC